MKHILFLMICIFTVSCSKLDENLLGQVPFTILYEGEYSLITQKDTWVIKNEYAWEEFKTHSFTDFELVDILDFNSQIVLAVSQGQQNTGGFSIYISEILEFEDHLEVNVQESSPLPGHEVTLALSQPFQIVVIDKTEKEIIFY